MKLYALPNMLDKDIEKFLAVYNAMVVPQNLTIAQDREAYLHFAHFHSGWPLKLPRVEDHFIVARDGFQIPVRIYSPDRDKTLPCMIYFHGGGWQKGDIATHDSICRHLSFYSNCIFVSVDWRLAPEHQFSTGIKDCLDVYQWIKQNGSTYNIDMHNIGLSGDSAGGNIVAAVFQEIEAQQIAQPLFQLLLYPSLDFSCASTSYSLFSQGYFLTTADTKKYINDYLPAPEDKLNPLASPILQQDLSYLPCTHIVYCGYDPLRGDSEQYIDKLQLHNVAVTSKCYEGMIHAFLHMNHTVPAVNDALQEIGIIIKDALGADIAS